MTPRGRFIFAPAAKAFMKRRNDVSNAFGSSMRKTRLNVSWLGKPFLSTSTSCQRYAFIRANSAMSVQLVAPHSVASNAMNKISVKSCSAFSARGSGRSAKHSPILSSAAPSESEATFRIHFPFVSNDLQKPTCDSPAITTERRQPFARIHALYRHGDAAGCQSLRHRSCLRHPQFHARLRAELAERHRLARRRHDQRRHAGQRHDDSLAG